jgi:hypothetical protein
MRSMRLVLLLVTLRAIGLCQPAGNVIPKPTITLTSLDGRNVYLLPSDRADVGYALDPGRDKGLDVLLPYSPVILNSSTKDIIAYSVRWTCTDPKGRVSAPAVVIFDFSAFPSNSDLPPGKLRMVSNVQGLGSAELSYARVKDTVSDLLALYNKQRSIAISLDAVAFDDGTAAGPDLGQWIPRWKAHIDAERDVYRAAAEGNRASIEEDLNGFLPEAVELARPLFKDSALGVPQFQTAANHASTYTGAYLLMRGVFAALLLDMVKQRGEAATISAVGDFVRYKRYPSIHREDF